MIARKIKPKIFRFSMKNSNKNLEIGKSHINNHYRGETRQKTKNMEK
jgi:hypothetical protein